MNGDMRCEYYEPPKGGTLAGDAVVIYGRYFCWMMHEWRLSTDVGEVPEKCVKMSDPQ